MLQRRLVSARPEFAQLPVGTHLVKIANVIESDSFTQYNGAPKEKSYGWANPCPQLIVTLVSATRGVIGGITHRFNLEAYKKFDKLTESQVKSGKFHDIRGYACVKDKKGDFLRIIDDEGLRACDNILNQALYAFGIPEGFVPMTFMDPDTGELVKSEFPELLASDVQLVAEIKVDEEINPETGNTQLRVKSFKRPKIEAKELAPAETGQVYMQ